MKKRWVSVEVEAPPSVVWDVLVDVEAWLRWGPSVRSATVDGGALALGARGRVRPTVGPPLPFEITAFEPGHRWAWKVGGVDATDHRVEPLGPDRCRLSFGVPWTVLPYLAICRVAIGRIAELARSAAP